MYWPIPFPEDGVFPERPSRMHEPTPDERLTLAVTARLLLDDRTRTVPITAWTQHGVVILTGVVRTAELRRAVGEVAATTDGVRDVCNALRVPGRRWAVRSLKALLFVAAYASLVGGIVGSQLALVYLALFGALGVSLLEARSLRRDTDAPR
ncbi:BON domain-containing protein [Cryptosporangium japonicum]|uniref:BON domain-containing protein n=1 Tax=Cryptosporangium japonicum TaxID=80872 RepID=A0ABN0TFZ2_9ACTN